MRNDNVHIKTQNLLHVVLKRTNNLQYNANTTKYKHVLDNKIPS